MKTNPMHQFEVYRIGPEINLGTYDIFLLQMQAFYGNKRFCNFIIFFLELKKKSLIPSKIQLLTEMSYTFISK